MQVTLPSFPEPENRDDAVNGLGLGVIPTSHVKHLDMNEEH